MTEEIEELLKELSEEYNVPVSQDLEQDFPLGYSLDEDVITYNPSLIKHFHEHYSKYRRIDLPSLIKHMFGHELAHRNKYISYGLEEAREIERVVGFLFYHPEEAMQMLPDDIVSFFPLYRACSISYNLIEEYYAAKTNPLFSARVALAEISTVADALRRNAEEARKLMHALPFAPPEFINDYFIAPLTTLPVRYFRIFPEYRTLQKIRLYLYRNITTVSDVFNPEKIADLAEIILFEL